MATQEGLEAIAAGSGKWNQMIGPRQHCGLLILAFALATDVAAYAESQVVEVIVHSTALEKNLLGDPTDQKMGLYLPAAYSQEHDRRFATIYFLHGFADTPVLGIAKILQPHMDKLISAHTIEPMIVVAPNGLNRYFGSFYTNSEVTGNWEDYIVHDVVGYMDAHHRTIPTAQSRGISGHSMGGYGALMLGFKHPEVFSNIYAMSPCCTLLEADFGPSNSLWGRIPRVKLPNELAELLHPDFLLVVFVAIDAAFAPDRATRPYWATRHFVGKENRLCPIRWPLQKFSRIWWPTPYRPASKDSPTKEYLHRLWQPRTNSATFPPAHGRFRRNSRFLACRTLSRPMMKPWR